MNARYTTMAEYEAAQSTKIRYYSGAVRQELLDRNRNDLGVLLTPNSTTQQPDIAFVPWAADNGCFTQPKTYSDARYLGWLRRMVDDGHGESCGFAPAPDVVGDAAATLRRSLPMLPAIRECGVPAALVGQDGLENLVVPWDEFDVLFLGGSDAWKLGAGARALTAEAKRRGKLVHMGRVNSLKRLAYAHEIGCDSADGTFIKFGPTANSYALGRWLDEINDGQLSFALRFPAPKRAL